MPKNYVYRMKCDRGFAPNIKYDICTLSGCKKRTKDGRRNIEELAETGSWVIGIGGNNTKKSNKLIYTMEVEKNLCYFQFKERYPKKHKEYLRQKKIGKPGTNVLVSKKFYYFGDEAIDLPKWLLKKIFGKKWSGRWYKCVSDEDTKALKRYIEEQTPEYRKYGVFGKPNNKPESSHSCRKCKKICP